MRRAFASSTGHSFTMPRTRFVSVPTSDQEIIEEVTTHHKTKRGLRLKQTRTPMTQSLPTKAEKPSGSRSKSKKKAQAPQVEKDTHAAEEDTHVAEEDNIMQSYEPHNDFEYQVEDGPDEVPPHANVCRSFFLFDISNILQSPMDQWLQHRSKYLNILLEMEGRSTSQICSLCLDSPGYIKCSDCFGGNIFCKSCCLKYHQRSPFHRLLQWNGRHYAPTSLYSLGFILFLGHTGNPCPKTVEVFV